MRNLLIISVLSFLILATSCQGLFNSESERPEFEEVPDYSKINEKKDTSKEYQGDSVLKDPDDTLEVYVPPASPIF